MAKPATYEVTLRRDVQQVTRVRVQAYSPKEAIAVAQSATDEEAWNTEEQIGVHRPRVQRQRALPIRGRETGKTDRRAGTDRQFDTADLGESDARSAAPMAETQPVAFAAKMAIAKVLADRRRRTKTAKGA